MDIQNQQTIKVNLDDTSNIKCEECENTYFVPVFVVKRISSLISPNGKEGLMPIQTFQCKECGHVNEEFQHNGKNK
jgi:predicted nucleic acid-binding Zn ribbon protein